MDVTFAPGEFRIERSGYIRTSKGECPICALWNRTILSPEDHFLTIAVEATELALGGLRGSEKDSVVALMDAADVMTCIYRDELLRVCKIV
jgi:hypothetical protein